MDTRSCQLYSKLAGTWPGLKWQLAPSSSWRSPMIERPTAKVICIAPGKEETIFLLNHNEIAHGCHRHFLQGRRQEYAPVPMMCSNQRHPGELSSWCDQSWHFRYWRQQSKVRSGCESMEQSRLGFPCSKPPSSPLCSCHQPWHPNRRLFGRRDNHPLDVHSIYLVKMQNMAILSKTCFLPTLRIWICHLDYKVPGVHYRCFFLSQKSFSQHVGAV